MRDAGPLPMLSAYAVRLLTASMSRKSSFAASGIVSVCHVPPPSAVRRTVPFVPLAHTTRSLAALTPRSRAVTPLVCVSQRGVPESPPAGGGSPSGGRATAAHTAIPARNAFTRAILPYSPDADVEHHDDLDENYRLP